nr:hypothetical protein [Gaetbulibacter sp. 4G1]
MKWRVVCNKNDAPGTIYDEKWKADNVARSHKRRNPSHKVKVQRIITQFSVQQEYEI